MAYEQGKLISAQPLMNGAVQDSWDGPHGLLYSWVLNVNINGVTKVGKALSKVANTYPIPLETDIVFSTDWVEKHGYAYFKGIKKADSQYANQSANQAPQQAPQQVPQQQTPVQTATPVNYTTFVNGSAIELALEFIKLFAKNNVVELTQLTIDEITDLFKTTINSFENKKVAVQALKLSLLKMDISKSLVEEIRILKKDDIVAYTSILYSKIIG